MTTIVVASLEEFANEALPSIFGKPSAFITALKVMPKDHPTDHAFKPGPVPGVCYDCGYIQPDVAVDCKCGNDLRWHAEHRVAPAYDEEAAALTAMGFGDLMDGVPSFEKLGALNLGDADGLAILEIG